MLCTEYHKATTPYSLRFIRCCLFVPNLQLLKQPAKLIPYILYITGN